MAAEPTPEPIIAREEEQDEFDEGEESDVYEIEGEEEVDTYEPEEDEDEDGNGNEPVGEGGPDNMTALLLGKQNGTVRTEGYDEEEEEEEDEEDEEYHEDKEGSAENPIDLSSVVAGSKRGVDELGDGDAYGDDDDDDDEVEEQIVAKKARV
ncbi:hypothetical protein J3R82DRAFT_202 [Butyriboletus roseoflavus]|nr:hypothetical protein J3R82DRAFT_202 [Butyriboletus roseoflavus]